MRSSFAFLALGLLLFVSLHSPAGCQKEEEEADEKSSTRRLIVTVLRGLRIRAPGFSTPSTYVRVRQGNYVGRTRVIRSSNPWWNTRFFLRRVNTRFPLRLEVWYRASPRDRILLTCRTFLRRGSVRYTCRGSRGNVQFRTLLY